MLLRPGRDVPGSNWHTYLFHPEGSSTSVTPAWSRWLGWPEKPRPMWSGVLTERPGVPQPAEATEVENALGTGVGIASAIGPITASSPSYP